MESTEKRKEIIKAAGECFSRYGYDKTTLDDIGKQVGLNKASLYYYYKNKEEIFTEVIRIEMERFITRTDKETENISGCKNKITTYIKNKFKFFSDFVNISTLSVETLRSIQPAFKGLYNNVCKTETGYIKKILDCCIKNGEIKDCNTEKIAGSISAIVDAIKIKALQERNHKFINDVDFNDFVEEVIYTVTLILDGLMI
jgi:AcrR family transcriptional regulator